MMCGVTEINDTDRKEKSSGKITFMQMRQDWSFFASHNSSMFTDAKKKKKKDAIAILAVMTEILLNITIR